MRGSTLVLFLPIASALPEAYASLVLLPAAETTIGLVHARTSAERIFCPEQAENGNELSAALAALPRGLTLDVGSYDGSNAIAYAAAGHQVLAFEPSPTTSALINRTFASSPQAVDLKLYPMAVSNASGVLPFYVSEQRGTRSNIVHDGTDGSEQDMLTEPSWPHHRVDVSVITLDEAVGPERAVTYAKLDAQGHDHEAIMGAAALIRSHRLRRLAFEVAPGLSADAPLGYARAVRFITSQGYRCSSCSAGTPAAQPIEAVVENLLSQSVLHSRVDIRGWTNMVCYAPGFAPPPAR